MSDLSDLRLLAIDTASIQHYIFNSNRLRENVGASYLVASVTGQWALETVADIAPNAHNLTKNAERGDWEIGTLPIEDIPDQLVEVIYSGGGNFVALIRNEDIAKEFTRQLSKRVLLDAPGLRVFIQHTAYHWKKENPLGIAVSKLLETMKKRRNTASNVMPLAGLGVTVMCGSTAMPAVETFSIGGDEPRPVSSEVRAKNQVATPENQPRSSADLYLRAQLPISDPFDYPSDFDDLGRSHGDTSFIALVHADGDGIGAEVQERAKESDPRKYIDQMRDFSLKTQAAAQAALQATIDEVGKRIRWDERKRMYVIEHPNPDISIRIELVEREGKTYIPIRPIVFGGDDVTFVCDARLGLALTTFYLEKFQEKTREIGLGDGNGLSACAGVAMVKSRYPFARAYALASNLCDDAKKARHQHASKSAWLHWHFALGGIYGNWKSIQQREYTAQTGDSLTLRPMPLDGKTVQNWKTVESAIHHFQSSEWLERRNKAKALRDALRGGEIAEKWFYQRYEIRQTRYGWQNHLCTHFDALELMDIYIPLEDTP